jgi:gliding motility-associated-like protein
LPAGTYTVLAMDANNCPFDFGTNSPVTLTQPEPILITTLTPITVPLDCWYSTGEDVNMQVSGGNPDYVYQWYKWNADLNEYQANQTSLNLVAPSPGYYRINVTDSEGCNASKLVDIPGPTKFRYNFDTQEAICRNSDDDQGKITINYVYWDIIQPNNEPTVQAIFFPGQPENQLHIAWNHSEELNDIWALTGLSSGIYRATITDENGCANTFRDTIFFPIENQFDLDVIKVDPICHNGSAFILANTIQNTWSYYSLIDSIAWYSVTPVEGGEDILTFVNEGETYLLNNVTSQLVHKVVAVSYAGCIEELYDTLRVYPRVRPYVNPTTHPFFSADTSAFRDTTVISILADTEYDMLVETYLDSLSYFGIYPAEFFNPNISFDEESEEEIPGTRSFASKFRFNIGYFEPYLTGTMRNYNTGLNEKYIPIKLYVQTDFGCVDSLELKARVLNRIKIPNVFTPNGDGVNDVWIVPYGNLFPEIEIYVYNRWGYTIWEGKGSEAHKGWNGNNSRGTAYPTGTYYYVVKFNVGGNSGWKNLSGSITILR